MSVPCKTNKCILYPVCIAKRDIICDDLRSYYHHTVIHAAEYRCPDKNTASQTVWEYVKESLPNMSTLKGKINAAVTP